jgi:hypothetical protein
MEYINRHFCENIVSHMGIQKFCYRKTRTPEEILHLKPHKELLIAFMWASEGSDHGSVMPQSRELYELLIQPDSTHMEVVLLLRLLNPADCLLSRLLIFSGEYGLLGRGGAFSHLRCSRSAIVPAMCRYRHMLNRNHTQLSHGTM